MIVLQAIRLDERGRFQFRIEVNRESLLFSDADAAAAKLAELDVPDPHHLLAHVRNWGIVEIFPQPGAR